MPNKHEPPSKPLLKITWVTRKQGTRRTLVVSLGNMALILLLIHAPELVGLRKAAKFILKLLVGSE